MTTTAWLTITFLTTFAGLYAWARWSVLAARFDRDLPLLRASHATRCDLTGHPYPPAPGYTENCRYCGERVIYRSVYDQEQDAP